MFYRVVVRMNCSLSGYVYTCSYKRGWQITLWAKFSHPSVLDEPEIDLKVGKKCRNIFLIHENYMKFSAHLFSAHN